MLTRNTPHCTAMTAWRLPLAFAAVALLGAAVGAWLGHRSASAEHTPAVVPAGEPRTGVAMASVPADSGIVHAASPDRQLHLQQLLQEYAAAIDEDVRGARLAALAAAADETVLRFALDLASSRDADARRRGLDLLAIFPFDTPGIREFVTHGLQQETDPQTLAALVELAAPTVMPTEDAAPLVSQLERLTAHADPTVRSRSVMQYAQWSGPAEGEALLSRAILDEDAEVRRAAIAGVVASNARSDRLKDALLWIAGDARASSQDRSAAVFALQSFALDREEYALYRQAAAATDDHRAH
ncbi:hypothetical protein [Luteimonas suaedae]|uniref:hypothetical protein n=1 Tax=Luteimonas suaedae TaxID=2605430 RepID=UPI0011EC8305|nr:hypothetical protein [Luteimonas suaedae]